MIVAALFLLLLVSVQGDEPCKTKDHRQTCTKDNPAASYFGADPCFKNKGRNVCFYSTTNYVQDCDCNIPACNCASSSSGGDDSSSSSSSSSCDNSMVPKSSDCSADKTTYCALGKDNTMCEYCGVNTAQCGPQICALGITTAEDKAAIVDKHNELRRKVAKGEETRGAPGPQPPASNMNQLVWDDEVAEMAQTWADQCPPTPHDKNRKMVDGSSGGLYCGQNVYNSWSTAGPHSEKGLAKAVEAWYNEVVDFDNAGVSSFGSGSDKGVTGHYTQVVWADVSKVGCGYNYRIEPSTGAHPGWYRETVVCNYCPGGNWMGEKIYEVGTAATDCPADHPKDDDGLCAA